MSDEIYYTSAPEGLRPGQRGFCTVAASAQISRPLWDRLESVSGYRHHFTSAEGSSRNPVAWAHWLIQSQGREISVLSRVCDCGLDYTQRTNAFAHHLALEPAERAAGGPAWMLAQPGVMSQRWDGNVGPIARSRALPDGDAHAAPCVAWQRMAGDAGWAGVVAEAAMQQSRRPVCILCSPEQDMLPLIAEAIALLPESRRWEISFNTYFTGLPSNAACAWRCCLSGTPAAAEAVRHAKGGILIDLSRPERLGNIPSGQWVDMARSGLAASDLAPARPNWMRIRHAPAALRETPSSNNASAAAEDPAQRGSVFDQVAEPKSAPAAAKAAGTVRGLDLSWIARRRRAGRRLVIGFVAIAMLFIGCGIWFRVMLRRAADEQPLPAAQPVSPEQPPAPETPKVSAAADLPQVHPVAVPDTAIPATIRAPAPTAPVVEARIPQPAPTVPKPIPPAPPPPVAAPLPSAIHLASELLAPIAAGTALRDPVQAFPIPAGQFGDVKANRSFQVMLPGKGRSYTVANARLSGTLSVEALPRARLTDMVTWRDATNRATQIEVATVALEPPKQGTTEGRLDVTWRISVLVKRPEVASLTRSVLQRAELVVTDSSQVLPRIITFKEPAPISIDITRPSSPLTAPSMPDSISVREARALPDGWQMTWKHESERQGSPPAQEAGVLSFERPISDHAVSRFSLRFAPGWTTVSSNWSEERKALRASVNHLEVDLDRIDDDIARLRQLRQAALAPLEKEMAEAMAWRKLTDDQLRDRAINREAVKQRIEQIRRNVAAVLPRFDPLIQEAQARRSAVDANRTANVAAEAALERIQDVDIVVELTDKLRVATLRLKLPRP